MQKLSLVIPTFNEEGNIRELVRRIDKALSGRKIFYELIFIDDHSTDKTALIVASLASFYPISLYPKQGKMGKAYSLIEGFSKARYDNLGMIDADLQYPPEAIPQMLCQLQDFDVVVANRKSKKIGVFRKFLSEGNRVVFGKLLHKLDCDIQSGLKIFKKRIINNITLDPTPWTFDLELLLKARLGGYKITDIDIIFEERKFGTYKVSTLLTTLEIGFAAVKAKFKLSPYLEPPLAPINKKGSFFYNGHEYATYNRLKALESAILGLTVTQKLFLLALAGEFLVLAFLDWRRAIAVIMAIFSFFYFSDIIFQLFLVFKSFTKSPEIRIKKKELEKINDSRLPIYSMLCPLYKEWQVVPQFISAISQIDYPKGKLQVIFLLEEDDVETIQKIEEYNLPSYFEIAIIPHSYPKTKPKACNFGLKKVRGKYCVIYDAEDVPEKDQLKKAVLAFKKVGGKVACIQAKLNFYNPNQNILTKLFTLEYSLWFDLVLPGLQSIDSPVPLGGTSNHFKTKDLKKLEGWDPFNVTEDCDLGIRLSKKNRSTAIIDSTTYEEANSKPLNWFWQRTRWTKGYIQTYLVHTRTVNEYTARGDWLSLFAFHQMIGGKVLAMLANPIMWATTATYFILRPAVGSFIESFFPALILYISVISLVFGNFLYFYSYMIASARKGYFGLVKYSFLIPLYWFVMSLAAWVALYKLIREPFYWSKTEHGLHLQEAKQTAITVSPNLSPAERSIWP